MCQGFLHAISSLQNTSYQLSLGHLDHVELLIRRVLELQMKCVTYASHSLHQNKFQQDAHL